MKIVTAQLGRLTVGIAHDEDGVLAIDTTVKSAADKYKLLAPTWDIVMGHKKGKHDDMSYEERYSKLIRDRNHSGEVTALIEDMLSRRIVRIYCYCKPGKFCHRHILAKWMKRKADELGIPCEIEPEAS